MVYCDIFTVSSVVVYMQLSFEGNWFFPVISAHGTINFLRDGYNLKGGLIDEITEIITYGSVFTC